MARSESKLRRRFVAGVMALACGAAACRQDMHDQPKGEPLEASAFFADGRVARPLLEGVIARGELELDPHLATGKVGGKLVDTFPFEIDAAALERGRQRYGIFCTPCHDAAGLGEGMIVQRGMKRPPSLHIERLREAPAGYFFDVMTNGFGAMYDVSDRIGVEDRWKIAAYVRALQLSQHASLDDVPAAERAELEAR
jgi:mono/diheme cytochrome c family protein